MKLSDKPARQRYKPLCYWENQRIRYDLDGTAESHDITRFSANESCIPKQSMSLCLDSKGRKKEHAKSHTRKASIIPKRKVDNEQEQISRAATVKSLASIHEKTNDSCKPEQSKSLVLHSKSRKKDQTKSHNVVKATKAPIMRQIKEDNKQQDQKSKAATVKSLASIDENANESCRPELSKSLSLHSKRRRKDQTNSHKVAKTTTASIVHKRKEDNKKHDQKSKVATVKSLASIDENANDSCKPEQSKSLSLHSQSRKKLQTKSHEVAKTTKASIIDKRKEDNKKHYQKSEVATVKSLTSIHKDTNHSFVSDRSKFFPLYSKSRKKDTQSHKVAKMSEASLINKRKEVHKKHYQESKVGTADLASSHKTKMGDNVWGEDFELKDMYGVVNKHSEQFFVERVASNAFRKDYQTGFIYVLSPTLHWGPALPKQQLYILEGKGTLIVQTDDAKESAEIYPNYSCRLETGSIKFEKDDSTPLLKIMSVCQIDELNADESFMSVEY